MKIVSFTIFEHLTCNDKARKKINVSFIAFDIFDILAHIK